MFLTSPITPEIAGAGEALGVCPMALTLKASTKVAAKMNIDGFFTEFLSFDWKFPIIYASTSLIVAKLLEQMLQIHIFGCN